MAGGEEEGDEKWPREKGAGGIRKSGRRWKCREERDEGGRRRRENNRKRGKGDRKNTERKGRRRKGGLVGWGRAQVPRGRAHLVSLVMESAGIAQRFSIGIHPPHCRGGCLAVGAPGTCPLADLLEAARM